MCLRTRHSGKKRNFFVTCTGKLFFLPPFSVKSGSAGLRANGIPAARAGTVPVYLKNSIFTVPSAIALSISGLALR